MTGNSASQTRPVPVLDPFIHRDIAPLLQDADFMYRIKEMSHGPVHAIFPHIMRENVRKMQEFFAGYTFPTRIFYTCKPNKSPVFLKEAFRMGISVDVSSSEELADALAAGFHGKDIGCTNLKNSHYIRIAMEQGCLISIDSLAELQTIIAIYPTLRYKEKCRILLRLSDIRPKDRQMIGKNSKFGIPLKLLPEIMELVSINSDKIDYQGVHFHKDNTLPDVHAGYIEHSLSIIEMIERDYGLSARVLDIGGGFRVQNIACHRQWSDFVAHLGEAVRHKLDTGTWNDLAYGIRAGEKGGITGRGALEARGNLSDYRDFLEKALGNTGLRGHPLHRSISDNLLTLMIEPGNALLAHSGFTIMRVNGTKQLSNGMNAIYVDGNIYHIASQFMPQIMDFIHIPQQKQDMAQAYDGFVVDNLCNENGILSHKSIRFKQEPKDGDLMVIMNTASYLSDFEEASPHKHPRGKKIVIYPSANGENRIYDEEYYCRFIADKETA